MMHLLVLGTNQSSSSIILWMGIRVYPSLHAASFNSVDTGARAFWSVALYNSTPIQFHPIHNSYLIPLQSYLLPVWLLFVLSNRII